MSTFGHVLIEGYCFMESEMYDEDTACREYSSGKVSHYCFGWDEKSNLMTKCKHFSWTIANNYIVMTDDNGADIACRRYEENEKVQLLAQNFANNEVHE